MGLLYHWASLQAMQLEEPFYLLDSGDGQPPALFYPMLNKCLAIPLLETWADYLWARGREEKLVTLLNDSAGQGYAAWRVLPATEVWQRILQEGLSRRSIKIEG